MLYMTVGERNDRNRAQNTNSHGGKMLRLKDDGTVPPDNPFVGKAGFKPEIYSYGHRNLQGLAVHPETGALWETEHGPQGGDELNLIQAGQELRLAGRHARSRVQRRDHQRPAGARGHRAAVHRSGSRRLDSRAWRSTPATSSTAGRTSVPWRARRPRRLARRHERQGPWRDASHARRRCASASATCVRGPTASSISSSMPTLAAFSRSSPFPRLRVEVRRVHEPTASREDSEEREDREETLDRFQRTSRPSRSSPPSRSTVPIVAPKNLLQHFPVNLLQLHAENLRHRRRDIQVVDRAECDAGCDAGTGRDEQRAEIWIVSRLAVSAEAAFGRIDDDRRHRPPR